MQTKITFKVYGKYALFTEPSSRVGGEKCSYPIPTYQALRGITEVIYWKPTFTWIIDRVRVLNKIQTESKNVTTMIYNNSDQKNLSIYTYLKDVAYEVEAHFEWNLNRPEFTADRNFEKHINITSRSLKRGGRCDVFLGTRECFAYIEPCEFGSSDSYYAFKNEIPFDCMFHGYDYPGDTGKEILTKRIWSPIMRNGIIVFPRPEECTNTLYIKSMQFKKFEYIKEGDIYDMAEYAI